MSITRTGLQCGTVRPTRRPEIAKHQRTTVNHPTAKAGGLLLPLAGRRQRLVDCSPLSSADVERGIVVRIRRKATSLAKERFLRLSIGLLTMPTVATGSTTVPGVYQVDGNAG